jgi:hypothetical protein
MGFSRRGAALESTYLVRDLRGRLVGRLIHGPPIGSAAGEARKNKEDASE